MAKILIVDDDIDFANAAKLVLTKAGYEVTIEDDDCKALEKVDEVKPDLVLLDVMFPEDPSAGFQVARDIQEKYSDLPVLMLTAINEKFPLGFDAKNINESWMPVDMFLEKPIDFVVLKNKIEKILKP